MLNYLSAIKNLNQNYELLDHDIYNQKLLNLPSWSTFIGWIFVIVTTHQIGHVIYSSRLCNLVSESQIGIDEYLFQHHFVPQILKYILKYMLDLANTCTKYTMIFDFHIMILSL